MKTAVLISGRIEPEDIQRIPNLMEQIIEPYKADVFIDTWIPYKGTSHKLGLHRVYEEFEGNHSPEFPAVDINAFAEAYKPKMMTLDSFDDIPLTYQIRSIANTFPLHSDTLTGARVANRKENIFFMWYKLYKANRLRKLYEEVNRIRYDRIIRTRFDSSFSYFPADIIPAPKTLYIPVVGDYDGGINDQFALGDSQAMDLYCDLYLEIFRYWIAGVSQHPESLLKVHLEVNRLNVKRFHCKQFLRGIEIPSDPLLLNQASIEFNQELKRMKKIRDVENDVIYKG